MSGTRWRGWIQLILGLGITFLFFYMMAPFVVATLIGGVTALICYPVHERLSRRIPSSLAAILVTSALSVLVLLPIFGLIYGLAYQALKITATLDLSAGQDAKQLLTANPWIARLLDLVESQVPLDPTWLRAQLVTLLVGAAGKVSKAMAGTLADMPMLILGFFVVILATYFFLVDGPRFLRFLSRLSPLGDARSLELYHTFENTCGGVVIGMFLSAGIQGVLVALFFAVTGVPKPLLWGLLAVCMGMVPVVGTGPVWIGAVVYLFATGSPVAGVVMILGGVLISLSDNIVRTLIMKGSSDMHPFLALVSVFGAVNLIGAAGIFLGPIIAAVFVAFLKILAQEIREDVPTPVLPGNP